jgi:hypothetical protein
MLNLGAATHEIRRSLRKIQMIPLKVCATKLIDASQKPRFCHSKNGKKHFSWDETKIGIHSVPRNTKAHMCV